MADEITITRLGQANLSGDVYALFKDQFIPELLTKFDEKRVVKNYVRSKTISKGKSASFPVLGATSAKYVTAGEALLGNQKVAQNEITINIDPFLVSDIELAEIDVLMAEYDNRAEIAREMGRALANMEDKQLLQVGVLAARASGIVTGREGGSTIYSEGCKNDAAKLAAAIYAAGVELDEKNVPFEDRFCFIKPFQFALLAQYDKIADKDLGGGSYSSGKPSDLNNITIIKTNHLPTTNIAQGEGTQPNNIYYGNFSNTAALVMNRQAVGSVSLKGLTVEKNWDYRRLTWLLTARILQGHGILRPECAVEIADAAPASGSGS
jgi:HK97 family phage major capsid protein